MNQYVYTCSLDGCVKVRWYSYLLLCLQIVLMALCSFADVIWPGETECLLFACHYSSRRRFGRWTRKSCCIQWTWGHPVHVSSMHLRLAWWQLPVMTV